MALMIGRKISGRIGTFNANDDSSQGNNQFDILLEILFRYALFRFHYILIFEMSFYSCCVFKSIGISPEPGS